MVGSLRGQFENLRLNLIFIVRTWSLRWRAMDSLYGVQGSTGVVDIEGLFRARLGSE